MDFELLKDLAQTLTRNKLKQIEVLGNADQASSRTQVFFDGLLDNKFKSEEDIARFFFGQANAKDPNYRKLKNKLVRQMLNTVFFVDVNQPSFNERLKAYFACYRVFAAAFVVMLRGSDKAGIYLFEQVLEQSVKYEFIELCAEITRHLRTQTARITSDQKQHQLYVTLHRQYEEKRRLEMLALDYHEELVDYYLIRRSPNQEVRRLAEMYFNELMPLAEKADTSRFYYYTYQVGIIKNFAVNDCQAVLVLVDEALLILGNRKNTNRSMLQSIALQKLACLNQLRIFDNNIGAATAEYCLSLGVEGELAWFRTLEGYFYYLSYQQKYQEAFLIFEKAINNSRFLQLEGIFKDNWLLLGGYLHLLAALGKLDPIHVELIVGPYRYGKLVNEMESVDKDREGMNIPLILLPMLFSLAIGDYQDYGRSEEALEKYRQRYLDNEMNQRSAAFMSMLMALDKKSFDMAAAERRIKKGLEVLSEEQPQVIGQNFAIEIIPYEDLWAMLTDKEKEKSK